MKKLLFFFALLLPLAASAVTVEINGIYYNLVKKLKTAEVISNPNFGYYDWTDEISYVSVDVEIPATVFYDGVTYDVTSIGDYAFSGWGDGCYTGVYTGDTFYINDINNPTHPGCFILTSITIPESITSIGVGAFQGCNDLTSVIIPNSVTSIGDNAFENCRGLTSVIIPNSVTTIGNSAFSGCEGLTSVTIGSGVKSIGVDAFCGCPNMSSVYISDLTAWCRIVFHGFFSNPLSYPGHFMTFDYPGALSPIDAWSEPYQRLYLNGEEIKDLVIPNSITSIGDYAFLGCDGLTSVTIHNSITSIGSDAFRDCSGLTSVHISDLEAWCRITFNDNPLLYAHHLYLNGDEIKDLVIPNSVTSIGNYTFAGCSGLTSVIIANFITSIGDQAFKECSGLTSVTIPNSVTSIGNSAFYGCSGLTSFTIPDGVTSIGSYAFSDCSGLTSVTIGSGVTSIGSYAFSDCSGLTSVIYQCSLTSNGNSVFSNCFKIQEVTFDCNTVTSLFSGNTSITKVTLTDKVTSIVEKAFYGCSGLSLLTIGGGIETIGSMAFANCEDLTDVYCYAKSIPNTNTDAFDDSYIDYATLHVLASMVDAFKAADVWKDFKEIVSLPGNVTVTVGPKGWATYIAEYDLDFSAVEGLKAYTATTDGMTVTLTQVDNVQIGTGLVLKGKGTHVVPLAAGSSTAKGDLISGVVNTDVDTEYNYYGLTVNSLGMAYFARITGTIAAGKAYLRVAKSSSARDVLNFGDDVTTGIQGVDSRKENGSVYNLQGVRVLQPKKGLYIVDGKKVNVK